MSSGDSVEPVDENSSTFALSNPDQGLPRKAAESCWFTILKIPTIKHIRQQ
jgi:hypothetical protein